MKILLFIWKHLRFLLSKKRKWWMLGSQPICYAHSVFFLESLHTGHLSAFYFCFVRFIFFTNFILLWIPYQRILNLAAAEKNYRKKIAKNDENRKVKKFKEALHRKLRGLRSLSGAFLGFFSPILKWEIGTYGSSLNLHSNLRGDMIQNWSFF